MAIDAKLNLTSIWEAATHRSSGEVKLGDILSVMPDAPSVSRIQTLARALFDAPITQETRPTLLPIAQKIREWKYFESLDWRARSSTKITLARVLGHPSWLITALECCKSFIRSITFSHFARQPVAPMLDDEIEKALRRQDEKASADFSFNPGGDDDDYDPVPQGDLLQSDLPQSDLPQGDLPQGDLLQSDLPQSDLPQSGLPQGDLPQSDLPQSGLPQGDLPQSDLPQSGLPQSDLPQAVLDNQPINPLRPLSDPIIDRLCAEELEKGRQAELQIIPWAPPVQFGPQSVTSETIMNTPVVALKGVLDMSFENIDTAEGFFRDPSYTVVQKARLMGHALEKGRHSMWDLQYTVGEYEVRLAKAFSKHTNGALANPSITHYLSEVLGKSRRVWAREVRSELRLAVPVCS